MPQRVHRFRIRAAPVRPDERLTANSPGEAWTCAVGAEPRPPALAGPTDLKPAGTIEKQPNELVLWSGGATTDAGTDRPTGGGGLPARASTGIIDSHVANR